MKFINTYKSPNFNLRAKESKIKFIILHYTAMYSLEETLNHLCNPKSKVSSHFLVSKKGDIYNIVDNLLSDKQALETQVTKFQGIISKFKTEKSSEIASKVLLNYL